MGSYKLQIDSSDNLEVKLHLISATEKFSHFFICGRNLSERLLPEIEKFLKKRKIKLSQLKKIEVYPGPGHFSRIRTAVATANALAFGLCLRQDVIEPAYDQPANITMSQKNI